MDASQELAQRKRAVSAAELHALRSDLEHHLEVIDTRSFDFELLDVDLARRITHAFIELIDGAERFDADQRALLYAGIDYYVLTDDAENDLTSPIGLEDDAAVLNVVCARLGREDLSVPTP